MARIGVLDPVPGTSTVAAKADIGVLLAGGLYRLGLEIANLVAVGANGGVTGQAGVAEHFLAFRPGAGQAHDLDIHRTMALEASLLGVHRLAQREPVIALWRTGRRSTLRFVARVISLVTGSAGKVHQILGHRCFQVASMKRVLVAGVGTEPLIPGLAGTGIDACW